MINGRSTWYPGNVEEIIKRQEELDLPNIKYNIGKVIDKAHEDNILKRKDCHPTESFSKETDKLLGNIYPEMSKNIIRVAIMREGNTCISPYNFIRHACDIMLTYIPKKDDRKIKRLSHKYKCISPAEILIGLAAKIKEFCIENNFLKYGKNRLCLTSEEVLYPT